MLRESLIRTAHGQITIPDPAQGKEPVCKLLYHPSLAADNNYYNAVVMIQVDIGRGDNLMMKITLSSGHLFLKFRVMVTKGQADDTHHLFVHLPIFLKQSLADQIPDSLGTIVILVNLDVPIELVKQIVFKGYGKSFEHILVGYCEALDAPSI